MIFDSLENYKLYPHEQLTKAFEVLFTLDENTPLGQIKISDSMLINILEIPTHDICDGTFEVHKHHIDIHYILRGREVAEFAFNNDSELSDYDNKNDIGFCMNLKADSRITVATGDFYVAFENRPHKPTCHIENCEILLKKAVVKINIQ